MQPYFFLFPFSFGLEPMLSPGNVSMHGSFALAVNNAASRRRRDRRLAWERRLWHLRNWVRYRWREIPFYALLFMVPFLRWFVPALTLMHSRTYLRIVRRDEFGQPEVLDLVGLHLITTAGKNYVAACFDNTNEPENLKYHAFGTGTTSAAAGDTALQTELTTQYATDNVRPTGSQAHSTNTYTTVATLAPDSGGTIAVTEWGLMSQASNAGGTLYDHQVFSAVNLVAGSDSLQSTYVLTLS
jgi:hypothetical protein